jgi:hypothetical protein
MNISAIPLIAVLTAVSSAQGRVVPVEQEPHRKTVLENDYVQVFRVTLERVEFCQ